MNPRFQSTVVPALVAGLSITHVHAAPLAAGDKIGIDFGPTAPTNFFNQVNPAPVGNGSIPTGTLINTSNGVVDGVGFSWSSATGLWFNTDASEGLAGQPAAFNTSNLTDWMGTSLNAGSPKGFITLTFTGLDDSLTYDLVIGAAFQNSSIVDVLWTADSKSATTDSSVGAGAYVTLTGLATDGSGNLVIVGAGTGATAALRPDIVAVAALQLSAVIDPTRWVLNGDGNWNTPANWSLGAPNAPAAAAVLDSDEGNITGPVTATLDVPATLGTLQINHPFAYTVAGANALTFDNAGSAAVVSVASGSHEISAPVTMAGALSATVATGAALDLSGTLSDGGSAFALAKNGTGNLVLSGDISGFSGLTTISAGAVTLPQSGDYSLTHRFAGSGRLALTGGGRVILAPTSANSHGGTDVSNGGTLIVDAAGDLGAGGVGFDNGTLEVGAGIIAGIGGWTVGAGGGTINVAPDFTLQGGRLTGTGTMNKTGEGTWRILTGGTGATIGLLTVSAGTLDLDRNDTFGQHAPSAQDLVIEAGALVTNGVQLNRGYNAFRNVTLNGGELQVSGTAAAAGGAFGSYGLKQTVTVGGTAPSAITDPGSLALASINLGNGAGTQTTFAVADVTGDAAVDLSVSAALQSVNGSTGLRKTGTGTMRLTRVNAYLGDTSVEEGTLILDQAFLADAADVELTTGATLQLDFDGTDTIDELFIDGLPQDSGTWGRAGHATAEHTTSLIAGDGLLEVTTDPPAGYAGWAGLFAGFTNTAADLDFENDGLASGIEWVVDGDPTANDAAAVAPAFDNTTDPANVLFTFRRRDDAATDPNTTIVVEYGSDLNGWTPAQAGWITVDDNGFGTSAIDGIGVDKVTVAIPRTLAAGGKLFARLRVAVVTP